MIYTDKLIKLYEQAQTKSLWDSTDKNISTYVYGSSSSGLEIKYQICMNDAEIKESRYKVLGCGYSIALCVWLSQYIHHKNISALSDLELANLIEIFDLPKTKYKCAVAILNIYHQIISSR